MVMTTARGSGASARAAASSSRLRARTVAAPASPGAARRERGAGTGVGAGSVLTRPTLVASRGRTQSTRSDERESIGGMSEVGGTDTGTSPSECSGTDVCPRICRPGSSSRYPGAYSTRLGFHWPGVIRTARAPDPRGVRPSPGQQAPDLVQYQGSPRGGHRPEPLTLEPPTDAASEHRPRWERTFGMRTAFCHR